MALLFIYLAFVSLGLPDALLGVAWPSIRAELALDLELLGVLALATTLGTALSSFSYARVYSRYRTNRVVAVSILTTAVALLGYAAAPSFGWLLAGALPLGVGAGAVDTALNSYVARHYSSRHMNWLHGSWGIGAFAGPTIMTLAITRLQGWRQGFATVAAIQIVMALVVALSFPLWRKDAHPAHPTKASLAVSGSESGWSVPLAVVTFLLYSAVETGTGLWLTSYLVESRGIGQGMSGSLAGVFYLSIAIGRLSLGAFSRLSSRTVIRVGACIMSAGALCLWLNLTGTLLASVVLLGLGCAPVFPAMVHETPRLFGSERAERITGCQVGTFYLGGVTIVPALGFLAERASLEVIPLSLIAFTVALLLVTESLYFGRGASSRAPVGSEP